MTRGSCCIERISNFGTQLINVGGRKAYSFLMELTTACVNGDEVGYEADIVEYRRADWRRREFIDNALVDCGMR